MIFIFLYICSPPIVPPNCFCSPSYQKRKEKKREMEKIEEKKRTLKNN